VVGEHVGRDRRRNPARSALTAAATVLLIISALAVVFRVLPVSTMPQLIVTVGATFVPFAALLGLVLAIICRRRVLSIIAVALLIATTVVQWSWFFSGSPTRLPSAVDVRVLSSNLRYGRAEPTEFVALATREADVVSVVELTPEAVERFKQAGIDAAFPYSFVRPGPDPGGTGIWSRYPVTPVTEARHRNATMPAVRVAVPGLPAEPVLAAVHVPSPLTGERNTIADWDQAMVASKVQLDNFARQAGPAAVIVGGDYNSTPNMRQFRDLLTNGYRDAAEETGSGFGPTFKADMALPPMITIDHILTRNAAVSSVRTISVKGSDHRALLATIQLPLDAGA